MSQSLRNRLRRLAVTSECEYLEIVKLIKQGAFYDDLTDELKDLYCRYRGFDREAMESVNRMVAECEGMNPDTYLHFRLERKPKPMNDEQTRIQVSEIVQEIEEQLLKEGE